MTSKKAMMTRVEAEPSVSIPGLARDFNLPKITNGTNLVQAVFLENDLYLGFWGVIFLSLTDLGRILRRSSPMFT